MRYVALVPVKSLARAKSRLVGPTPAQRRALVTAFALDVLGAVAATPAVGATVVLTADARVAERARRGGASVLPDVDEGDLNAGLNRAAEAAATAYPLLRPLVVCADLPALCTGDLGAVLDAAGGGSWHVADAAGTGTTLYAAHAARFRPAFGPGSAAAHRAGGAHPVAGAPGLRRDVDTWEDLREAVRLGVGPRTASVLAEIGGPGDG